MNRWTLAVLATLLVSGVSEAAENCKLLEPGFVPEGKAGERRLALLVGVGDYLHKGL